MKPFVKWAGGKRQLLDEISRRLPDTYGDYYEPFLGGGAVLFGLQPKNAFVCDINPNLVDTYRSIRDDVDGVLDMLRLFDSSVATKETYMDFRDTYNHGVDVSDAERAALFIWLNKHAFNGLYRENSKGEFNVPFNNKTSGDSFDEDNLREVSAYLRSVDLSTGDFEEFLERPREGDFVYVDSPYVPVSDTANFTGYAKDGFSYEDHKRLMESLYGLSRRGVKWMMSNNDVDLVRYWYKIYNIQSVDVRRSINAKGNRKGREVIITNY
ncbi:MAG: DNA adenine methylase [Clostridia bacterium]|nr:DNA adenine methylase [Clostridia bacterium]